MTHHHDPVDGGGFFAGSMLAVMLVFILLLALVVALIAWQPWTNDNDGAGLPGADDAPGLDEGTDDGIDVDPDGADVDPDDAGRIPVPFRFVIEGTAAA
jgi:hypothetical protein